MQVGAVVKGENRTWSQAIDAAYTIGLMFKEFSIRKTDWGFEIHNKVYRFGKS